MLLILNQNQTFVRLLQNLIEIVFINILNISLFQSTVQPLEFNHNLRNIMISKLAVSIAKRNISTLQCMANMQGLKLMHFFSDNNKKNPFQKFKRTTASNKNNPQPQKPSQSQNQQNQQKKSAQKSQENTNQSKKFQQQKNAPHNSKESVAGFSKFKKRNLENNNLSSKPQKQQKENLKHSEKSQQQQNIQKQTIKRAHDLRMQPLRPQDLKKSQNHEEKAQGFQKFKKIEPEKQSDDTNAKQIKQTKPNQTQKQKPQSILNSKSSQQIQKEKAGQNTQKKIQEDKEEWEGFLQDQIKKEKEKKLKKQHYDWKNFDFTSKKKTEDPQKPQQKNTHQEKGSPYFQMPKTPLEFMKFLFVGGVALYLGSIFVSELFFNDNYRDIETDQMIGLLKEGRIRQTWFLTTVQSLSEESSRTKKYACATLENNQICKCQSNSDFQISWNKIVDQHNTDLMMLGSNQIVIKKAPIIKKDNHIFNSVRSILSFALLFMFLKSIMSGVSKGKGQMGKGGGLSGMFQNTKSHRFRQNINVKFNDVVGMNRAKQQIVEFIDFLKNAQKYNKLGAKIPRGALLTGPPGTGKTMLAKACAGQSGVPFFTISGSQFMEMYVGVGAQRVRNLFAQAKQAAPSIIFIDQIDAVGKKRSSGAGGGGNDERDNTLNQMLVEMDGFDQTTNVIVFAATNQKQVLDPALTRPGRFDRLIEVDLPDIQGRKQIFMVHLKPISINQKHSIEQYANRLATLTPGFSGADIKNLCNQAAIIAARDDKKSVSMIDFEMASQRIIGGVQKKSTLITPQTKKTVAYHQCGHGVVSWFMQHASPLLKLTIIPRSKGALGYAQYLPNENQVYTRKQLEDQICVILGGRMAEQVFFKKISTGASDDLQKAHKVAKAVIAEYGMGKNLSWLSYGQTEYSKQYSHVTEQKIDDQIMEMIYECSIKTRAIINEKKDIIQALAQLLLKEETIDQRMIQKVLGQRPFKSSKQYEDYIREKKKMEDEDEPKLIQGEAKTASPAAFKFLSSINNLSLSNKSTKMAILQSN